MKENNLKKYGFLPVGKYLQLFADEGNANGSDGNNTDGSEKETYTKDEYESLKNQLKKFKDSNDKLSSELAQKKKAERDKLSQEEKDAEARKEKDAEYEQMKNELNSIKMKNELLNCGIEDKAMSSLIEVINDGNPIEISKQIASIVKAQVEKKEKELKLQSQHTQHYPQPSNNTASNDTMSSYMKNRVASRQKK